MKIIIFDPIGHDGQAMYDYALADGLGWIDGNHVALVTQASFSFQSIPGKFDRIPLMQGYLNREKNRLVKLYHYVLSSIRFIRFVRGHVPEVVHYQFLLFPLWDFIVLRYLKLLRVKLIYTVHDVGSTVDTGFKKFAWKACTNLFDGMIFHSSETEVLFSSKFHINGRQTAVIPHGNYLPLIENKSPDYVFVENIRKYCSSKRVVMLLGSLTPYKGIELLLNSFSRVAAAKEDLHLIIAGSSRGRSIEEYEGIILQERIRDRVTILNKHLTDNEVLALLSLATVLVLPYTVSYTPGVAILAMTFGVPVIASDQPGFRSVIVDGENGFIVEKYDVDGFCRKMLGVLEDQQLLDKVKINAKEFMVTGCSWAEISRRTMKFYKEVISAQ